MRGASRINSSLSIFFYRTYRKKCAGTVNLITIPAGRLPSPRDTLPTGGFEPGRSESTAVSPTTARVECVVKAAADSSAFP